ncbi:MAG: Oxidoreductase [Ramalina farinacea]|uniref:Mitochondrial intermembrane space import and assembly protein 40 n=1 Tax=Ramalina farinacea TaxID=258253 RepID=A0AA43QWX4_9LECA|nr:Oxidoreductase [Ramalina farinacea]
MIRQAPRYLLRRNAPIARSIPHSRRFLSTAPPPQRSRSLRSSTVRWGLAIGLLYWYNTSDLFAEEASCTSIPHYLHGFPYRLTRVSLPVPISNPPSPSEETTLPTLDDIARARQKPSPPPPSPSTPTSLSTSPPDSLTTTSPTNPLATTASESDQQGAFNEETGEINWDCPCLGGMAHGPCGEPFRAAFSCFVYSDQEPKGMECIDRFKGMQECFREHPEIYGEEFEGEEEEMDRELAEGEGEGGKVAVERTGREDGGEEGVMGEVKREVGGVVEKVKEKVAPVEERVEDVKEKAEEKGDDVTERAKQAKKQVETDHGEPSSESDEIVPKAAHDAR